MQLLCLNVALGFLCVRYFRAPRGPPLFSWDENVSSAAGRQLVPLTMWLLQREEVKCDFGPKKHIEAGESKRWVSEEPCLFWW